MKRPLAALRVTLDFWNSPFTLAASRVKVRIMV
jgi:hypothetical protein